MLLRGGISGGVAKCRVFSQAIFILALVLMLASRRLSSQK